MAQGVVARDPGRAEVEVEVAPRPVRGHAGAAVVRGEVAVDQPLAVVPESLGVVVVAVGPLKVVVRVDLTWDPVANKFDPL